MLRPRRRRRGTSVLFGSQELFKLGVPRFDLRDPYYTALSLSWPGFAALVFALVALLNVGFALLYVARPGCLAGARPGSIADAFFFSIETMATVGYGEMAPAGLYGHVVATAEIVGGMATTAIITGLLFVRFSRPQARLLFSDRAVVAKFNGRPTLMVRLGNGRSGMLGGAVAAMGVLLEETTQEGQNFRRMHELALVRSQMPLFPLTWLLMHVVDETSPLWGRDAAAMAATDPRLFVTVSARDHALGVEVRDTRSYAAADIAFGMRFADTISKDAQGRTVADLGRLSLMEADGPRLPPGDPAEAAGL